MALKFLFCQEFSLPEEENLSLKEKITKFQSSFKAPSSVWSFTRDLLEALNLNIKDVDQKISSHLVGWTLDRISITDRNILRLALTEMLFLDTPAKVAINEAVDLTKKYSTKESASFINGLLDKVFNEGAS
jgi:N utilization substance protein B